MKNNFFKYILIASLSFNIAFIGMGLYKKISGRKIEELKKPTGELLLKLEKSDKGKLNKIISEFQRQLVSFRSDILDKRIEIIQELGDPEFTIENVKKKIDELNDIENELNYSFMDTLIEISSVIGQNQWLKFLYNLSEKWFFSGMKS